MNDTPNSSKGANNMKHWHFNWIITIVVLIAVGFVIYQIQEIKNSQRNDQITQMETKHFLLSTIDWSTQRLKLQLFMRDIIIKEQIRVGLVVDGKLMDRAFEKSNSILSESERYPGIQPLLLLAVQQVESAFNDSAISNMGAMGEWQLMPSTAMLLCEALGISYSNKVYYDPVCTRLAGKYFDILKASYSTDDEALADYNGGPKQAYFYKANKNKLDSETSAFVYNVLKRYSEHMKEYETYKVDTKLINNPEIRPDSIKEEEKAKRAKHRRHG
jgi:Soluble lytic murein transglycosylase and related regulatory proteins (some contain LysM/invasin domains)